MVRRRTAQQFEYSRSSFLKKWMLVNSCENTGSSSASSFALGIDHADDSHLRCRHDA
jgi:hypothetical protein